jgi:hypothetical protein
MAIIYAISSSFESASWNDTNTWQGGIVPTSSDEVRVWGVRGRIESTDGTNNGWGFWTSSEEYKNIFIDFLTSLPQPNTSGSFYCYTDRNQEIKIDYSTFVNNTTSSGTFFSCSVDTNFNAWASEIYPQTEPSPSTRGGIIGFRSTMITRPGTILLTGSEQLETYRIDIRHGGAFHVLDSASIKINNYIQLREGTFKVSGSVKLLWNKQFTGTAQVTDATDDAICFIAQQDSHFSKLELEGPEVRTYTTLISSSSVNDAYFQVISASNFEVGDWVFVGEENILTPRRDDGTKYIHGTIISSEDESFYIVGKDTGSNYLYVQKHNGIESKIFTSSSLTKWIVDSQQWKVGDKVVINNQVRTITAVEDHEHLLADYDFTDTASVLSDWILDTSVSTGFKNWGFITNNGLSTLSPTQEARNTFRHTFLNTLLRNTVKVECWVSNMTDITGSNPNNTDTGYYGISINSDPSSDNSFSTVFRNNTTAITWPRTYFGIWPDQGFTFISPRNRWLFSVSHSLDLAGVPYPHYGQQKLTLESSKGFYRTYINDSPVFDQVDLMQSSYLGRVGIFTTNYKAVFTRFKVYAPCQKITLNAAISASPDDKIYETGTEYTHSINDKLIKLTSTVTDALGHKNLAYAFIGSPEYDNTGIYPIVKDVRVRNGLNGFNLDYPFWLTEEVSRFIDLGRNFDNQWITIDLKTPTTFSNVGFIENFRSFGQIYNQGVGIEISGSNDYTEWTFITGGLDLRPRVYNDSIRSFDVGTQVYRYIRIRFDRMNNSFNEVRSIFVRNFNDHGNKIQINNASDFNVGDHIYILPEGAISTNIYTLGNQIFQYILKNSSSADLLDGYPEYHTIVSKTGSIIELDRRYDMSPINKGARAIKLNRELQLSGSYESGSFYPGRIFSYLGNGYRYLCTTSFKNVGFSQQSDEFPYRNDRYRGPMQFRNLSSFSGVVMQGCSLYHNWTDGYFFASDSDNYRDTFTLRHNAFANIYNGSYYLFPRNQRYMYLPFVFTGNIFINIRTDVSRYDDFHSYFNDSHNMYIATTTGLQNFGNSWGPSNLRNGQGARLKHNRNVYWSVGTAVRVYNKSVFDGNQSIYEVKNNKIIHSNWNSESGFAFDKGIETLMLPTVLKQNTRSTFPDFSNYGALSLGLNVEAGIPTNYLKDFNRWGYDIYTHSKGWITKFVNDDFYRFYNFRNEAIQSRDINSPLLAATLHVTGDVTASFDFGFTYYNSKDQIIQLQLPFSQSFQEVDDWIALRRDGNNAGALALYVKKDGGDYIPFEILPKKQIPTKYTKKLSLEGEGVYYIYIAQATDMGYVAIKDLNSRLVTANDGAVLLKANAFNMKNFGTTSEKSFLSSITQFTDRLKKLRLKGARIF